MLGPQAKAEAAEPGAPPLRYWEADSQHPFYREHGRGHGPGDARLRRGLPRRRRAGPGGRLAARPPARPRLAAAQGEGPGRRRAGPLLRRGRGRRGRLPAGRHRQRPGGRPRSTSTGRPRARRSASPARRSTPAGRNRVRFDIEGRGTFGYAVTLTGFTREFGPDQDRRDRSFCVDRRVYLAAEPEFEGKPLPTGFGVGGQPADVRERGRRRSPSAAGPGSSSTASRYYRPGQPAWERDFLVVEEPLPAGATLVEGSVQTQAVALRGDRRHPDPLLRPRPVPRHAPPTRSSATSRAPTGPCRRRSASAYEPGRFHLGQPGDLTVLAPGEASTDPYRPTPDELYARGKALFDAGRLAEAAEALGALWAGYTLRDDVARDAARMLLTDPHRAEYNPRQGRPVLRGPQGEGPRRWSSRSTRSWSSAGPTATSANMSGPTSSGGRPPRRATWKTPGSARSSASGARPLEAVAYLLDLWRSYPNTASIESDFFGLSQVLGSLAVDAEDDPSVRRDAARRRPHAAGTAAPVDPADPGLPRPVARQPDGRRGEPGAGQRLPRPGGLRDGRRRWPGGSPGSTTKSDYLDSFQYTEALGRFHLGQYDRAIEVAETIAKATYKDDSGVEARARTSGRRSTSSARSTTPAASRPRPSTTTSRSPTASPTPPAPSGS